MLGPHALITHLHDWPVTSQQRARRNAMVAATECAQRRADRDEVEGYFAALAAPAPDPGVAATRR